ncbi:alginate O-acetyltransferase AlgF [Janthinobacterium fluminis]|uniref:Alginate biosynthesis protein AlgF n=1 Tax=Janthinobacterium fluminis TaxID=2987524 RepID=A0ABT5K1I2_9BURK|nr:alginate O-acetyltransferase AlgF [Janthinobacterium fluminis]MDC8758290.1 alginate O-acetyltransferase AlgF [Janthinobacterium fluminis]
MTILKTLLCAAACGHAALAGAQQTELARLYAAQPPAGAAFVRAVNATGQPLRVALGAGAAEQELAPRGRIASAYRVVDAARPLALTVNGAAAGAPLTLAPDTFASVVVRAAGTGHTLQTIADTAGNRDGLRAELRFYNLAPACVARLALADGAAVFEQVAEGQSRQRAINPVAATVVGQCGDGAGQRLTLPALKAADHYSIFLLGGAVLAGQLAQTEPYQGAR